MVLLGLLALLGINQGLHASGYRDISTPRQNYPVMAKYDSDGILRYCDGKRRGKPVGGKKMLTQRTTPANEDSLEQIHKEISELSTWCDGIKEVCAEIRTDNAKSLDMTLDKYDAYITKVFG